MKNEYELLQQLNDELTNEAALRHIFCKDEDVIETVLNIREQVIDKCLVNQQQEESAFLYACAFCGVDANGSSAKSLKRWKEVYLIKLREMIASGCQSAFVGRSELFSKTRQLISERVRQQLDNDKKIFDAERDTTNMESDFQCPKCKSFKTRKYPLQMRSADEPMAILWKCFNCGKQDVEK
jgi:DNA-directed RNA polymerase subunit M/transcription elongation factor TFIIS